MKAVFLAALLLSAGAAAAEELVLSSAQIKALGIATRPLQAQASGELSGMPALVTIPGNQLFSISAPLAAMIEQTLVGIGDNVKKGQVLATLQSPGLTEAQRALLQASTQAQLAEENLKRDEQLWQDGIIAESRYRATKSQAHEAAAMLAERRQMLKLLGMSDSAIAELQNHGKLSSLLTLTAPIDGVVLEKTATVGQRVEVATPLFKVAKLEPLALEIQVPLASTTGLQIGAAVRVPALGARGKLTAIGRSLSGGNQTILLRALITEGADRLRPGQHVEASIATTGGKTAQWQVPNAALARIGNRTLLFVASAKGFRAVSVTLLNEGMHTSLISGDLHGNEQIAVQGVAALKANLLGLGGGE